MKQPSSIWTIGHSTRSLEQFVEELEHHRIEAVADVRRFPGSRRLPQFGGEALRSALGERGIDYCWFEPAPGACRLTEPGLAQCIVSRLCQ